jgi:hypothetical protein
MSHSLTYQFLIKIFGVRNEKLDALKSGNKGAESVCLQAGNNSTGWQPASSSVSRMRLQQCQGHNYDHM